MKREFFGDSFDAVKRLWRDTLQEWAPLHAESRFIPEELKADFTRLTKIPVFTVIPTRSFSIFNDPDTGIRLPGEANQKEGRSHISIDTISQQLRMDHLKCVVTFDQSYYRHSKGSHSEQRRSKMREIESNGFHAFYYVSHAPFLFAAPSAQLLSELKGILNAAGIPVTRFDP